MEILPYLLGLSVLFFFGAIAFFFWNVNNGQYDDLESPAHKILFDDDDDMIPDDVKLVKKKVPNNQKDDTSN